MASSIPGILRNRIWIKLIGTAMSKMSAIGRSRNHLSIGLTASWNALCHAVGERSMFSLGVAAARTQTAMQKKERVTCLIAIL